MTELLRLHGQEQGEKQRSIEQYRMLPHGGRVKAAGVSFQILYEAAAPAIESSENTDAIFATSKRFAKLKENPPFQLRAAFFPQDEGAMRTVFKGSGIYRPTIKTDQGTGGNVGYFFIDEQQASQLTGVIGKEEGVAVVEAFLRGRFNRADISFEERDLLDVEIQLVQEQYQKGNYSGTFEAINALRERSKTHGIETIRRAGVGRGEFFFFRPVRMKEGLVIGQDLAEAISAKTEEVVSRIEKKARITKSLVASGMPVADAVHFANDIGDSAAFYSDDDVPQQLYFQPDVLIRRDGTFDIERINMPDLGMFLTHPYITTPTQNDALGVIRGINDRIKDDVFRTITESIDNGITLVTRDEVRMNAEDTLELLELAAVTIGLQEKGIEAPVDILSNIDTIPLGSSVLLFNVSSEAPGYENLLYRVAAGELRCFPDPFLKLFEKETTTFRRIKIDDKVLPKFLQIIAPSALDKPEGVKARYVAIQTALERGGISEDIVYFGISGNNGKYVPTFRYDVKSFFEVYKAVEAAQKAGNKVELTAIPVPFKPEDAVLQGPDGPRLAMFRFMFVRK